eukprot:GEMP01000408.1.p1 GENE.GEMP01000408.1~~GEMP01000408.1.p1  ORF type:complete len:673 (+),score=165.44 GEMP01000408.1:3177-5195(+)
MPLKKLSSKTTTERKGKTTARAASEPRMSSSTKKDLYEDHDSTSSASRPPPPMKSVPKPEDDASFSGASNIAPTPEIEKRTVTKLTPLKRITSKIPSTTTSPTGERATITTPSSSSSPSACSSKASCSANAVSMTESNEEPFAYVISLGQFCMTANYLRDQNRRKFSTPFDWCYTNIPMVQWCLRDKFAAYLNPKLYVQLSSTVTNTPRRCGHEVFSRFMNRKVVFNHHNPLFNESDDMEYFSRCAQRFRLVLASTSRKLFVMTMRGEFAKCKEVGGADLLFAELQKVTRNFLLLFVYVVEGCANLRGKKKMLERRYGDAGMEIYEVRCEGGHAGLVFKEARDAKRYHSVLLDGRSFELVEDPLKAKAEHGPNVRAGKYGDLDEKERAPRKKANGAEEVGEKRKAHDIADLEPQLHKLCKIQVDNADNAESTSHENAPEETSREAVPADATSSSATAAPEEPSQTALQNSPEAPLSQQEKDLDMDADSQPVILHVKPPDIVAVPKDVVIEIDTDDDIVQIDLTNVEDEDKRIIAEQANWDDVELAEAHDSQENAALDSFLKKFTEGDNMDVTAVEALLLVQDNVKQQLVDDYNIAKALHSIEEEDESSDDVPMRTGASSSGSAERERRDRAAFQMDVERLVAMGFPSGKATATLLRCGNNFERALDELLMLQ